MRRVLLLSATAALAVLMAACATTPPPPAPVAYAPPPPPPPPPTPEQEFAWSVGRGPNNVAIQIAFQPATNQQWSCNGLPVALMPETSYSRGRMQVLYGSTNGSVQNVAQVRARSAANPGPDYGQFVRSASCDASESVNFPGLQSGAYFVIARSQQVRPPGAGGNVVIMQRIEVGGGQSIRIVLPLGARPAAPSAPPPARPGPPPRGGPR